MNGSKRMVSVLVTAFLLVAGAVFAQSTSATTGQMGDWNEQGDEWDEPNVNEESRGNGENAFHATIQASSMSSINAAEKALMRKIDERADERASSAQGAPAVQERWSSWISPYYRHTHRSDMESNGGTSKDDSGGSAFGLDIAFGNLVIGGAFDGGYTRSKYTYGDVSSEDKNDFYGITMYADWTEDKLRIYGGLGFSLDDHDIEVKTYGFKQNADSNTYALTWALIGEYKVYDKAVYVTPYAGVRHAFIDTESYKLGTTSYDSDAQNIFRFPIGVKVGRLFNYSGFTLRPACNFSVEPVCGDTKTHTKIHSRTLGTSETSKARMTDDFYWDTSIGVTAGFYGISLTLAYGFHGSEHETEHGVSLTYNWRF